MGNQRWLIFLISEGYQVIDADKVVRQLQEPDGKLFNAIMKTFGSDFTDENGKLNRAKLSALVFLTQINVKIIEFTRRDYS